MKKFSLIFFSILVSLYTNAQQLKTGISVHDPVIIRQDSTYYIFCTGRGISVWSSNNMRDWKKEKPVFDMPPQWAIEAIPGFKGNIWAPDISYHNGLYYLFYSVSVFGKNTSAIGLATNPTLNIADDHFHWTDHGMIIQSTPGKTHWNAIDPNLITDNDGTPYLAFGSFWDGIKLIKLISDRLAIAEDISSILTIASQKKDPSQPGANAIEGAFIFKHGDYFYLFASIDYCCKGPQSTYKMIIGRSATIKGPYLDKDGIAMNKGGGSILLQGDVNWYGVGHNGIGSFEGADYIIFHAYDAADKGIPKLQIEKLDWNNGWPEIQRK